MKDPSDIIRSWLYNVLYGMITYNSSTVPVYSFAPKDAAMPYIIIGEQTTDIEEGTKDCYITSNNVTIEVYASYTGNDATYKAVNSIAEDILEIVRQRTPEISGSGSSFVATFPGYNAISITLQGAQTDRLLMDKHIVVFKNLTFNFLMEEFDFSGQYYDDWFLPSKDELGLMYTNLKAGGYGGTFTEDNYWSSSQGLVDLEAWAYNFTTGVAASTAKTTTYAVRGCRTFISLNYYTYGSYGPSGGLIFHRIDNGGYYTYYEAAPSDQSITQAWSNIVDSLSTGTAVGTGSANTTAIIAQAGHISSAAKLCSDLNI